jgi:uncharacterized membrane protein
MPRPLQDQLATWQQAGLIDAETGDRIQAFEAGRVDPARLRWPVVAALAAGGLMLAAGALLFVAAHWATLPPGIRLAILLVSLIAAHAAAAAADRFPALASTLHTVGTVMLGAAIFLAGQTWNLDGNWPQGFLLWAIGAWAGWLLLRSWPQLVAAALLTPGWLLAEWMERVGHGRGANAAAPVAGLLLLALVYLHADGRERHGPSRTALATVGAFALFPLVLAAVLLQDEFRWRSNELVGSGSQLWWWIVALALPLAVSYGLRGRQVWLAGVATLWVLVGVNLGRHAGVLPFLWTASGAIGLAMSGVYDGSRRRINLGLAGFALTVVFFYFSSVLDKLGRSASLLTGGLLFLGLGWALERLRRRLLERTAT